MFRILYNSSAMRISNNSQMTSQDMEPVERHFSMNESLFPPHYHHFAMPRSHIKSALAKGASYHKAFSSSSEYSSGAEEDRDKTQRFTDEILGKPTRHTAKRHSFSLSPGIERQDSGDAARFIPGAYPVVEKRLHDPEQLPSTEHPSGSNVGVGSLPGTITESSVALLPEEHLHPDPYLTGIGAPPKGRLYRDESPLPMDGSELPTHEHPSGSRVGVGSLPGPNSEAGVAILPEERIHPDPIVGSVDKPPGFMHKAKSHHHGTKKTFGVDKSELPTHEHPSCSRVGVGSLPGSNYEAGVAVLPEERIHPDPIVGDVGLANFSQPKHKFYKKNKHIGSGRGEPPTRERPSGSNVGVGSMPGAIYEPGVATLPEERVDGRPYGTRHTGFEENLKEEHPSRKTKSRPAQLNVKSRAKNELPTTEEPSGSRVGMGSMPGSIHEAGVATLPEERIDGRPYGSGHTGFEDTLGHGHTFRPTHPNGGENAKPRAKSKSKSKTYPKHAAPQIVVNKAAKRYLMEQNPISFASSHPDATTPKGEEGLPGDTIFSATQRAKKKDPSFTHGKLDFGAGQEGQPDSGVSTKAQRDWIEQAQAPAEHAGHSVLETVEGAALGAMHGAENVLHRVEESAKAFVPDLHLPHFAGFGEHAHGAANKSDGVSHTNAAASRSAGETALPEDKDITDAAESNATTISGRESKLPHVIQREYYKKPEKKVDTNYDLFGDKVDYSEFVYEDDESYEGPSVSDVPYERKAVRPSDVETSGMDKGNIQYGRGGVPFTMAPHKDGTLPGYPTQEGLNRLIGERMRDDHLRAAGAKNPFKFRGGPSTEAVQGPMSGVATSDTFDPYAISDRYPRERRETPIFVGGKPTAADKYEAVFRDEEENPPLEADISHRHLREKREVPIFKGGRPTASGEYEAIFREKELLPAQFVESRRNPREMREIPVFKGGQPTAAGKYEAAYRDEDSLPGESDISSCNLRETQEVPVFMSGRPTAAGKYEAVFRDRDSLPARADISNRHPQERQEIPVFKSGKPTAAGEFEAVYRDKDSLPTQADISNRHPQEKREFPVFKSGRPTAAGEFEAVYRDKFRDEESLPVESDISSRRVREKREVPVFKCGKPTAAGEYEAVFKDEALPAEDNISNRYPQERPEMPVFKGGKPTASGKFEAVYRNEEPPHTRPSQTETHTTHMTKGGPGFKVGYLGKAVSPEEEAIEIERARRAAVRKMGID